ncbi:hypothetical protein CRENPOLYSF2_1760006 [Crenothrix polyspora]|uniref:Uncharacterized protein n=1 Tax=Crenothrix polyspora TaxID=360316 RepID=A0A1R4H368_9GAMM|nr:hypothetical protein CRENPOLYSF2_1760006 [Crenothrix polyspora]
MRQLTLDDINMSALDFSKLPVRQLTA